MLQVNDNITGETRRYNDIDELREGEKREYDESVHGVIDNLCDAYRRGEYVGADEAYLGVTIESLED